ncbi:MAG: class I SAM-dependent methyltransferase [Thermoguttaceae bacterium]|nr:class I SAM-dependent methyltransferase [Thermoguttaceae bacterium]
MSFSRKFFNQASQPEGFLGALMIRGMNRGHAPLADWGIKQLGEIEPSAILDIGCGGGLHLHKLLKRYPGAKGAGIDISPLCVKKAVKTNRKSIESGRCAIQLASVTDIPFPEKKFDLVTAFETVYFWPGLEACFAQAAKVLREGGVFLIVNETDGEDPIGRKFEKLIDRMTVYTGGETESALRGAGFSDIRIARHSAFPWIAVCARK